MKNQRNWQVFQQNLISLPCLLIRRKERVLGGDSFLLIFLNLIYFLRSLETNPVLTRCRPPTYCAPPSTYNNFYGNHSNFFRKHTEWLYINRVACFWKTFSKHLELDGEIKQYICLHIYKKDVFIRLLYNIAFTFAKYAFLIVLSLPNLQWMGVSKVSFFSLLSNKQIS